MERLTDALPAISDTVILRMSFSSDSSMNAVVIACLVFIILLSVAIAAPRCCLISLLYSIVLKKSN